MKDEATRPRWPPRWPETNEGWHDLFLTLDTDYKTDRRSPLHHDNRCPLCTDRPK